MSTAPLEATEVRRFRDAALAAVRPVGDEVVADRARVDLIGELERLKSAACALQAELALDLDASVRSRDARQGVRAERRGRGVAAQVALARQESPHRGGVLLGLAKDLATDLTCTHAALREGRISEYRAQVIATETGPLSREDRALVDEEVCGLDAEGTSLVDTMGTAQLAGTIRRRVQALDPAAAVRRASKAKQARRVSIRPTPDTMVYLSGLLPVAQGVAAFAALTREADALIAQGDARTKGQVMADLLVERLTGQATAHDVGLNVDVIISDTALLGGGHEPAVLPGAPGASTVPAQVAREIIAHALRTNPDPDTRSDTESGTVNWIRTLYADPTGRLVAMTSKQRFVVDGLADFLLIRDQGICRTPWCDAPATQRDHVQAHAQGGETTETNSQGLCQACNLAKQADGWTQRTLTDTPDHPGPHTVETTTPTGHRHRSRAPAPPSPARPPAPHPRSIVVELYRPAVPIDYAA